VKVIADSSFLIALAMVDTFSLLRKICPEVTIPDAVYDEVVTRGTGLPGAEEVARAAWITRVAVKDVEKVKAYRAERLGAGEAEVLTLADELQADVVLVDDERAWEVARQKGIAYMRSTELILEAHRRQLLDGKTAEEKLVELGKKRWMSGEVLEAAMSQLWAQQTDATGEI
jgi:predicted nucleic acid-binding protein